MPDLSIFKLDSETITIKDTTARQAAESAKTLATTASGNATTALNKINELESEKADTIISSTSGAIASFPDGADDMPIKSLKVGIEPVQDLHGYENPWPAGGGKNVMPPNAVDETITKNGITLKKENGVYTLTGTATSATSFRIELKNGFTCPVSIGQGGSGCLYFFNTQSASVSVVFLNGSTTVDSWQMSPTDRKHSTYATLGGKYVDCITISISDGATISMTLSPMFTDDGTDTATIFSPYSNICPISGWTGAKVTRTGKNLFRLGSAASTRSVNGITVTPNSDNTVTVNGTNTGSNSINVELDFGVWGSTPLRLKKQDANYKVTYSIKINGTISGTYDFWGGYIGKNGDAHQFQISSSTLIETQTVPKDARRLRTWFNIPRGASASNAIIEIQAELGSTATAYEPYQSETYEVEFPSEAGTVYGGSLDVTTGVLTVDRAQIASYAGETLPSTWISDRDVYSAGATPTTGAQVVYKLATPITYQLTAPEITTLLGQNNIWADAGDTSVTYKADTKLYIDNKFTELQALILENLEGETDHD